MPPYFLRLATWPACCAGIPLRSRNGAAGAERFAGNVLPVVDQISATGATTFRAIAAALNSRGVRTVRSRDLHATTRAEPVGPAGGFRCLMAACTQMNGRTARSSVLRSEASVLQCVRLYVVNQRTYVVKPMQFHVRLQELLAYGMVELI